MAVLFCSDTFWHERGAELTAIDPSVEVVQLVGHELVSDADLERITRAFFSGDTWPDRAGKFLDTCTRAPNPGWLQTFSARTDHPVFATIREAGVVVTSSSGSSAPSIARTVMLCLLAQSRDLPRPARAQAERRWDPERTSISAGSGSASWGWVRSAPRSDGSPCRSRWTWSVSAAPYAATRSARRGRTTASASCSNDPTRSWSRRP